MFVWRNSTSTGWQPALSRKWNSTNNMSHLFNDAVNCQDNISSARNKYGALMEWCWQGKNQRTWRKTCPTATLSTTNPTWTDLISNPALRGALLASCFNKRIWETGVVYSMTEGPATWRWKQQVPSKPLFLYNKLKVTISQKTVVLTQKQETIASFRSALSCFVRLNGFRRASCHHENCQENKSNEKDLERTENLHVSPVGDTTTGNTGYVDSTVNLPTKNPYYFVFVFWTVHFQ